MVLLSSAWLCPRAPVLPGGARSSRSPPDSFSPRGLVTFTNLYSLPKTLMEHGKWSVIERKVYGIEKFIFFLDSHVQCFPKYLICTF